MIRLTIGRIGAPILLLVLLPSIARAELTRVLLVHDAGSRQTPAEEAMLNDLQSLLAHFESTATLLPATDYQLGEVNGHDSTIYVGMRAGAAVPDILLGDLYDTSRPVCWLGEGLGQLDSRFSLGRFGFRLDSSADDEQPRRVSYQGRTFWRAATPLPSVTITDPDVCTVVAEVATSNGLRPYAVRSGGFHYFAEVPVAPSELSDTYLILADYLHEFLGAAHAAERIALISIGPVNAGTNPMPLAALLRVMRSNEVAVAVAVRPSAGAATGAGGGRLSQHRSLVSVLRGAQRAGATIMAISGLSEPAVPATAEAGDGREPTTTPETALDLLNQMGSDLDELALCGLYPLAWEVSRDALAGTDPSVLASVASTIWVTRRAEASERRSRGLPFLPAANRSEPRLLPDNMPRLYEGRGEVEAIVKAANRLTAVPDPWATVSIAPEAPPEAVELLLNDLRASAYQFADLRAMACSVTGEHMWIRSVSEPSPLGELMPADWHATIEGPGPGTHRRFESPDRDHRNEALVQPRSILVAYPPGGRPRTVFSWEGDPGELTARLVQGIARVVAIFAVAASLALLLIYFLQVTLHRRA